MDMFLGVGICGILKNQVILKNKASDIVRQFHTVFGCWWTKQETKIKV